MVATILSALLAQQLMPRGSNPVLLNAVEESIVMDGDQCDNWFKVVQTHRVYYAYATDAYCQTWTLGNGGQPVIPGGYVYPNVFKVGPTYYMTTLYAGDYHLYLWSSTDKTTWALANGGQPVLHHGTVNSQWFYTLINTTVAVDGTGRWHLLLEGKDNLGNNFHTGYSYSTLAEGPNFDTHLSAAPVFSGTTGNPWLVFVPERNALLAVAGAIPASTWVLRAWSASLGADLTQAVNWTLALGFGMQTADVHLTDPSVVFSSTKPWGTMLAYHHNQLDGWRAYGPASATGWFDQVTIPTGTQSTVLELGTYGDTQVVRLDTNTVGIGAGATGTVQAGVFRGRVQMPNGNCVAPSAFFGTATQTGVYLDSASVGLCVGGAAVASMGATGTVAKGFGIWGVTSAPLGGLNLSPTGDVQFGSQAALRGTAPTISSPATLAPGAKHYAFLIDVGAIPTATMTLTLPAAAHGWVCHFDNLSNPTDRTYTSAQTTTSAAIATTAGWAANDRVSGSCFPYEP
jgi:hypothetical protein